MPEYKNGRKNKIKIKIKIKIQNNPVQNIRHSGNIKQNLTLSNEQILNTSLKQLIMKD